MRAAVATAQCWPPSSLQQQQQQSQQHQPRPPHTSSRTTLRPTDCPSGLLLMHCCSACMCKSASTWPAACPLLLVLTAAGACDAVTAAGALRAVLSTAGG